MDVDIEKLGGILGISIGEEEPLPERGEVEGRGGEEEECDFGLRVCGGEAGLGAARVGDCSSAAEEGEVVELVGGGDLWEGGFEFRGEIEEE